MKPKLIFALLLIMPAFGQSGDVPSPAANKQPSLAETLDWLKEKIPLAAKHYVLTVSNLFGTSDRMGNTKDITITTKPTRFDSCTIAFEAVEVWVWEKYPNRPITNTTRYTVPLGSVATVDIMDHEVTLSLSPTQKLKQWVVVLESTSTVILDEVHEDLNNTTKTESRKSAFVAFYDRSVAQRVVDAFKHAAELCKGKEPF